MAKVMLNGKEFGRAVSVEVPEKRAGLSLGNFVGAVDADGTLAARAAIGDLRFDGVKILGDRVLKYAFYYRDDIMSVLCPELTMIGAEGLESAFRSCGGITSVSFPELMTIGALGTDYAFYGCFNLTSVSFPKLTTVGHSGMQYIFGGCPNLTSVSFPELTEVDDYGLNYVFDSCDNLTSVSFPKLTTVGTSCLAAAFAAGYSNPGVLKRVDFPALTNVQVNSFGSSTYSYAFLRRTTLEEIHFRADMQATIEAMTGYADKWGATNATIYFDL